MQLIKNGNLLRDYLENVLKTPEKNECYCLMVVARKKYLTTEERALLKLKNNDVIRREIVTSSKSIFQTIKAFETIDFVDDSGVNIPEHSLVIYITENPRCMRKAAIELSKEIIDRIADNKDIPLYSLTKSFLHKFVSRKIYMDFDFDIDYNKNNSNIDEDLISACKKILKNSVYHIIKTKGGFHLLLEKAKINDEIKPFFYQRMKSLEDSFEGELEIRNDSMTPLPGCIQGEYVPFLL